MRTNLILTTAALGVASSLGAMAQVYSVNAVGYINVTVPPNALKIVANQLDAGDNTVNEVLPTAPDGTILYKYSQAGGFTPIQREFGEWGAGGDQTIAPGEGFFVLNSGAEELTLTFVGEVPQGALSVALQDGLNMVSSPVPQAGGLTTDLGFPPVEGDIIYRWNDETQSYAPSGYEFGEWSPTEPAIEVGEGFLVDKNGAGTWTRDFDVNDTE